MSPPRFDAADGPRRPLSGEDVTRLLAVDPAECADAEVADAVIALSGLADQVDAALSRWTSVFDARTIWAAGGARSPVGWLTARAEVSRPQASALVHRARDLRSCPVVDAAYAAGTIGTQKVRLLLRARSAHPELFAEHEAGLVEHVTPLTVAQAATVVARWEQLAESTAGHDDGEDQPPPQDPAAGNSLHLSRSLEGRWLGTVDLDPVTGAQLDAALAAHVDQRFRTGTYHAEDGLPLSRRKAEALGELCLRGAAPDATKHGDPRPSVTIQLDHRTVAGVPAEDLDDGLARRCCLDDGTPVPRSAAERLLCNARITHVLVRIGQDGAVETVGVTDQLRDATRKQRRALKRRDGGCAFAGCDAPVDWCDAHHLTPFHDGGPTLLANLVLLCRFHHHQVHEGGWQLWRDETATLRLRDPHGTEVPCPPHGHLVPSAPGGHSPPPARPPDPRFARPDDP